MILFLKLDEGNEKETLLPPSESSQPKFTIAKILSLAIVDAINPCALAVLILMLTAILAYNPGKEKYYLCWLSFVLAVFVMYLIYGLLIVKFFQVMQGLSTIRLWLYKALGVIAIILGILNIKDFIKYKPGNIGTEMPMFMRGKVKNYFWDYFTQRCFWDRYLCNFIPSTLHYWTLYYCWRIFICFRNCPNIATANTL